MATNPGVLTEWPWKQLGKFKYLVVAPLVVQTAYCFAITDESERDYTSILLIPLMLWRAIHDQIWISFSRYQTARGKSRIVDKSIDFEQVDRESNW
ncbi:aldehyde oxygenase (deformylating) [Ranunculus cassubicifolius]